MNWNGLSVFVTAGVPFVGTDRVDALIDRGAPVTVVDNMNSGELENIRGHPDKGHFPFGQAGPDKDVMFDIFVFER